MIKYYNNKAEYDAAVKSHYESQVSLIGESGDIKYDGRNVVVGIDSAITGSTAVLDGLNALHFISAGTYSSASFMSNYTIVGKVIIGVDHPSFRGEIAIEYKSPTSKKMSDIYQYRLTGYICDGTDREGVLSIRESTDSWAANHDYTIPYNASDEQSLVNQLNEYFANNANLHSQQWRAVLNDDNTIDLYHYYVDYRQSSYNKGASGFALKANIYPDWTASDMMLRFSGHRYGYGAITDWKRALKFLRGDVNDSRFNPSTDVTSVKRQFAVCLPAYLGQSKHNSDHCSYLRAIFGNDEKGWLRFVATCLPVRPTEYGAIGLTRKYMTAKETTQYLASHKYISADGLVKSASPAADFAANVGFENELLKKGEWVIPDIDLITEVADNHSSSTLWSCSRCDSGVCWSSYGNYGYAYNYNLYYSYLVVPLALLKVPQSAL